MARWEIVGIVVLQAIAFTGPVYSHACVLTDLIADLDPIGERACEDLELTAGWSRIPAWRVAGSDVACPIQDLASFPVHEFLDGIASLRRPILRSSLADGAGSESKGAHVVTSPSPRPSVS
jgi:hypothetical protein